MQQLFTNHVYSFSFIAEPPTGCPSSPPNGPYTLLQILTYDELISTARITKYPKSQYGTSTFLKLMVAEGDLIAFVPDDYLASPALEVFRYPKMMLTVNLGTINDDAMLTMLENDICGILKENEYVVFSIPWTFTYVVNGDHDSTDTTTLTLVDTTGIVAGDAVENITGIPAGTTIASVDSGTQVTLSDAITDDIADGTTLTISDTYTVDGEHTTADDNILTLNATAGIVAGDAVETIDGISPGTTIKSVDSGTQVTLTRNITGTIDTTTELIIHAPTNEQPTWSADDCRFMSYDYAWLTKDELPASVKTTLPAIPNPYTEKIRLQTENAKFKARIRVLEDLLTRPVI